jgi:hypothetical protein
VPESAVDVGDDETNARPYPLVHFGQLFKCQLIVSHRFVRAFYCHNATFFPMYLLSTEKKMAPLEPPR